MEKSSQAEGQTPPAYETDPQSPPFTYIKPQARLPHDASIAFEEYHYYAAQTREEELAHESPQLNWRELFSRKTHADADAADQNVADPHLTEKDFANVENRLHISDEEWANASRAFRSASWGACFYLITTDILGPYGAGYAMGTLGWGPGIALYTVFGFMAGYSGYLVWRVFLGTDSYQFPVKNYGDLAFRTWGSSARYITNICQALGLLLITGQVTIQYGENISQMSRFKLCYAVCPVIFAVAGFFITQIRTLRAYGWVANAAVWLNLLVIFITMGVIAHSPPNYAIATLGSAGTLVDPASITQLADGSWPPIIHYTGMPPNSLVGSINGLLSAVLAYAGVQLFVEFLAEMKRPRDFIKAMWGAQFFIYAVYLIYGCFVYYYQGQYSFNPSYMGVSIYGWQTTGNMITLIAALIAGGLYGNIGIKVLYNNILLDLCKAPPLTTRTGKILYAVLVPIWWIIAFVIAAAIPDYLGFVSVIAASMLLNLTYTFPPLFALGYDIQRNAIRPDQGEGFDPATGRVTRRNSSSTLSRLLRGFCSGGAAQVAINVCHVLYFLASLAMCGLGMYAAVDGMIVAFEIPELNSFSCVSPLNLNA
ncbi:hypothetical protein ASPZODRAFT_127952 [Penicilliopsis zonata CBS 506.65]|uniref:Amino acid transporter transmembrane domain-containing protein n=1 Tax=Penicilliopsis zonata CBS 506.65 TaxID=1073090 RepID=A0A1L9SXK7_9EURO|nr:hypothetical protein ASPZODRAFT_127952 [Penicilliopsis zonata CBS 506.65]OJJ51821.1 hypothetical protein ASPZODRAFT_127952 [Penicilliopsis zonata CBS 506.65]